MVRLGLSGQGAGAAAPAIGPRAVLVAGIPRSFDGCAVCGVGRCLPRQDVHHHAKGDLMSQRPAPRARWRSRHRPRVVRRRKEGCSGSPCTDCCLVCAQALFRDEEPAELQNYSFAYRTVSQGSLLHLTDDAFWNRPVDYAARDDVSQQVKTICTLREANQRTAKLVTVVWCFRSWRSSC